MPLSPLFARLRDPEDRFVERKPETAGPSDFKRSIVAFANSVPVGRSGVLFIGVGDRGELHGVTDPDGMQKKVRKLAENDCYPPIYVDMEALAVEDRVILAVVVGPSSLKPHFAGPAYVRRNSESVNASAQVYEELLLSRDDKRRALLEWKAEGQTCRVMGLGKKLGQPHPLESSYSEGTEAKIEEVTAHYVKFRKVSGGVGFTEPLRVIVLSWDDQQDRPYVIVTQLPRSAP